MSLILHLFYSAARSVVAYISCVAWWRIVVRAVCWFALATIWSQVRVPRPLRFSYDPGQVVHTHVPLFDHQAVCIDTGASWELKQALHATHWPRVRGLAASTSVWLRATETEISAALWAFVEDFSCFSRPKLLFWTSTRLPSYNHTKHNVSQSR